MEENKPSYLQAMLTSKGNVYALLGAGLMSVVLSIPFGWGLGAVPLIAFAAGEAIAALFVPDSGFFRAKVDAQQRRDQRFKNRQYLVSEIQQHMLQAKNGRDLMPDYLRMIEHVTALYRVARNHKTHLSEQDVEQLDDATLDFLSYWLSSLVISERTRSINAKEVENRLEAVEDQLENAKPGQDNRQLMRARDDYAAILLRRQRMLSHKEAIDAALLAMPDQFDEIYQTLVSAPMSVEAGNRLQEALSRLRLQEDIETELADELNHLSPVLDQRHNAAVIARRQGQSV